MSPSKTKSSQPDKKDVFQRKISATLIDYAKPLLDHIDEHTTEEEISIGLMVAITVWNAMVLDRWWTAQDNLNKVRSLLLEKNNPQGTHLIEVLADRKRKYFSEDLRAISDYSVSYKDGHLHVHAEARIDRPVLEALRSGLSLPIPRKSESQTTAIQSIH
jgi:hypothetical protein